MSFALLLSGRCNLSCAYCYQNRRRGRASMSWETARTALRSVLSRAPAELVVEFSGGEPLLEAETLRRAVGFLEANKMSRTRVQYILSTNGTLLSAPMLAFALEHDFVIRLSLDGVPEAQSRRGEGTFGVLDRLLDYLRDQHPNYLAHRVKVVVTLLGSTIPLLSESVSYLLNRSVADISIGPRLTWDSDWGVRSLGQLRRQVRAILQLSFDHWLRTGAVPVAFLRGASPLDPKAPAGEFLCGAPYGITWGVDPAGRVWACPLFASSLQVLPPLALEVSRLFDLGDIADEGLFERLRALPGKAGGSSLLSNRLTKRSAFGACDACRFLTDCQICPASICHIPGNRDPDLVPDFVCAFNRVTLAARQRFEAWTGGIALEELWRPVQAKLEKLREVWEGSRAAISQPGGTLAVRRRPR